MRLVLDDVSLALPDFTLTATIDVTTNALGIFGPSGAGKTTLLEIIAGVRTPDRGRIVLDDIELTTLRARERRIGYVPQDDTLFPHMSVRANVMYGVQWRTSASPLPPSESDGQAGAPVLHWIDDVIDRSVEKLSGGERRRVALARALMMNPRLLLLDELLAGLDDARKEQLIDVLRELRTPMIFVSHVREEIATLCEQVITVDHGVAALRSATTMPSIDRART